ncbi:MAG: VOC family protein [Pseudomonadota bacterium]
MRGATTTGGGEGDAQPPQAKRLSAKPICAVLAFLTLAAFDRTQDMNTHNTTAAATLDHIVLGVPDLESGIAYVEDKLGVRAAFGGIHPDIGTHNALLSLGDGVYLEIAAIAPNVAAPPNDFTDILGTLTQPRIISWALSSRDIAHHRQIALDAGLPMGDLKDGSRAKPNGDVLRWRLTQPMPKPLGGTVPFLIDWGETPHPSKAAPAAGAFVALRFAVPEPTALQTGFTALGLPYDVTSAPEPQMTATIKTAHGLVELP